MLQNNENLKNGKFKYTKDFLLQQRTCSTEAPVGFHPVYINQKRIEITQNSTIAPPKELPKELPNELPKESFKESYPINQINQTITNNIRILLNKLTPKNHSIILDQLNDFLKITFIDQNDPNQNDPKNPNDPNNQNNQNNSTKEISSLVLLKMTIDITNNYRDIIRIISQHNNNFLPIFVKTSSEFIHSLNEDTNPSKYPRYFAFFKLLPSFGDIYSLIDVNEFIDYVMNLLDNPTMSYVAIEILCNYCNSNNKKIIDKLSDLLFHQLPSRLRFMIHDAIKK